MPRFMDVHDDLQLPQEAIEQAAAVAAGQVRAVHPAR